MEGPWVGNWRPHPRRGPILAEFSTPGPKYGLPGLTGHMAHDPTKDRAPAYSFRGSNAPATDSCSPGPRYFIESSITKTGKQVAPSALVTARPKSKILVTPGPSDYTTERANKHVFHTAPANSLASRPKDLKGFRTPGPGTYTLPRILGPNTPPKAAQYSWAPSKNPHCLLYPPTSLLLLQTPGPAAFDKVDLDVYKTRAPKFSMGLKTKLPGKGAFPGPLSVTKARDPAFSFGLRHSLYKASLIPETHVD
uniref:Uncharacterized protein n=1 Tax=Geospiza parvula TaxID=87175 RepID=A0A8C3N8J5_GEOPR